MRRFAISIDIAAPANRVIEVMMDTDRYLAFEANGLKARSENPGYRHS